MLLEIVPKPVPEFMIPLKLELVPALFWVMLATVFPVIFTALVTALAISIPYTTLVLVREVLVALRLLATLALPTVLFVISTEAGAPFMAMPRIFTEPVPEFATAIPPMVLLDTLMAPGVPVPTMIPENTGAVDVVVCVNVTLPVEDVLPSVLPVVFPILKEPVTAEISDCAVDVLADVTAMLRMVFPCIEVGVVAPTVACMPRNTRVAVAVNVKGVPPQFGAVPPMKLLVTTKLLPLLLESRMALNVAPEPKVVLVTV